MITAQYFALGETISGTSYFYTKDRLASVREMTNNSGVIQDQQSYDSYGRVSQLQGSLAADMQFAGYYLHTPSGLNLTKNRALNCAFGRWLNRDLLGESAGTNVFAYIGNSPLGKRDPSGLQYEGNNCLGWSCGPRSPSTPNGSGWEPAAGSSIGAAISGMGFSCHPIDQGQPCDCPKCQDKKFILFFFGLPVWNPDYDYLGQPFDPANIGLHSISWNQSGSEGLVPGWSNVTQPGWPLWLPGIPYDGDPYAWSPEAGGAGVVLRRYCCCQK